MENKFPNHSKDSHKRYPRMEGLDDLEIGDKKPKPKMTVDETSPEGDGSPKEEK